MAPNVYSIPLLFEKRGWGGLDILTKPLNATTPNPSSPEEGNSHMQIITKSFLFTKWMPNRHPDCGVFVGEPTWIGGAGQSVQGRHRQDDERLHVKG